MMRPLLLALSIAAIAGSATAQAAPHASHPGMQPAQAPASGITTVPADGAMLSAAPTAFSVTFPHAMTLKTLTLSAQGRPAIQVAVPANAGAAATVSAPLPTLSPGTYTATWSATGQDGHQMNGAVRFMVH